MPQRGALRRQRDQDQRAHKPNQEAQHSSHPTTARLTPAEPSMNPWDHGSELSRPLGSQVRRRWNFQGETALSVSAAARDEGGDLAAALLKGDLAQHEPPHHLGHFVAELGIVHAEGTCRIIKPVALLVGQLSDDVPVPILCRHSACTPDSKRGLFEPIVGRRGSHDVRPVLPSDEVCVGARCLGQRRRVELAGPCTTEAI